MFPAGCNDYIHNIFVVQASNVVPTAVPASTTTTTAATTATSNVSTSPTSSTVGAIYSSKMFYN